MEQLKVKKKDVIVTNTLIYLGLSLLFLFLQYAYRHHISPFSFVYLKKSLQLFWFIVIPLGLSMYFVWKHHKFAKQFFIFSILIVGYFVIQGLFIEFNKVIVVALFFYVVFSYFLYQLLGQYLSLAFLNANYSSHDLFQPLLTNIPCEIIISDRTVLAYLTNWDTEGCFIKMSEPLNLKGAVKLKIFFAEREFIEEGEVVAQSTDLTGVGLKLSKTAKDLNVFNWSEFIELVHELGYDPERLR